MVEVGRDTLARLLQRSKVLELVKGRWRRSYFLRGEVSYLVRWSSRPWVWRMGTPWLIEGTNSPPQE